MTNSLINDSAAELERLQLALKSAQIGTWTLDIPRQQVWWDAQCKQLYGFHQDDVVPYDQVLAYMHQEDRQRVSEAISWALDYQSGGYYDVQFRTVGADDGQVRWLHCRGRAEFDAQGVACRFAGTAQDISQQVLARQSLKESQAILQAMIDVAELGTYCIDLGANRLVKSPRVAAWYGLPEVTDMAASINRIQPSDQQRISQVLAKALELGSSGTYQVDYVVVNPLTHQQYRLQTVGQVRWGLNGQPTHVDGLVRDITLQHELQLALRQQVQQRSEELAAANEALRTTNEALLVTNEDFIQANRALETANANLVRSNQNLEQFAYIASHDLQEPLRKIQQFGDLLKSRYATPQGEELIYLERMQTAANRMSTLIRDLLAFSRISTTQAIAQPVSLGELISQVLDTLSVTIEESEAQVEMGALPTVKGDRQQLGQLFQNLLSNALKFRWPRAADQAVSPHIIVRASLLASRELPPGVEPPQPASAYHLIEVVDNGIGFDEKYVDRIFEVFQRLHGKNEFAGTGVGLAIVQKVVTNHGGTITARSQVGQGATFSVYLPG